VAAVLIVQKLSVPLRLQFTLRDRVMGRKL
jgi:hypothetical protein